MSGYSNNITNFIKADSALVLNNLKTYIKDAGDSQIRAWRDSIVVLQRELSLLSISDKQACDNGSIILEYTIPMESRRIDAVILLNGVILSVEFKGKSQLLQADLDQAAAYARDLKAYHRECSKVNVECVLVLTLATDNLERRGNVNIISAGNLASYCTSSIQAEYNAVNLDDFLSDSAYQPLPTLIKAARELFQSGSITRIHRAAAKTEPTLKECSSVIHTTASNKRRALILISGVPGAGKTLVGLQLAHAKYLDHLSIEQDSGGKPNAPAVFLSGNGPLVEVLQYELKAAGGDGKSFVRGVHDYVKTFTRSSDIVPPQHVLIYDEAQRAFDAGQVKVKHKDMPSEFNDLSEPELFIQFAERVPDWCVVVGLIGTGQEIHIGEEGGLGQWADAINKSNQSENWDVYIPNNSDVIDHFQRVSNVSHLDVLELDNTIRFHLATQLYDFVECLLEGRAVEAKQISQTLELNGYHLRLTHDLDQAKSYLHQRYSENPDARYGMVASSRDKDLKNYGIPKGFKSTGEVDRGRYGKWYSEPRGVDGSCCELDTVTTEFGAQGLELDACLLAWGTDFIRKDDQWNNDGASGYRDAHRIKDAKALRMNTYRVLLTRGRDGCVVFIPPIADKMRETYSYLNNCGFLKL